MNLGLILKVLSHRLLKGKEIGVTGTVLSH